MRVWVLRKSSRSRPAFSPIPCSGVWLKVPLSSTVGTAPPWPGPEGRGTGDQALHRKQADTVREVKQALPEVQKAHSFSPKTPSVLSSRGWAFFPNINNRLCRFKNEIQNKVHQYPAIQKAEGFPVLFSSALHSPPLQGHLLLTRVHPWH